MNLVVIEQISRKNKPDFILNLLEDPYIPSETISFLHKMKIGIGNLGDLVKVLNQDSNWPYIIQEIEFVTSFLSKHDLIKRVKQLDSKRYIIYRHNLPALTILALDRYDIGIESIRFVKFKYKNFQAILSTNPNARVTNQAKTFAKENGIKIYFWGELLSNISKIWN